MLFKPLWPVVEYVVNYDYIVNVLCVNKDNQALKCDGKCYLAKQIAKEAEQGNQNPFEKKQSKTDIQHIVFFHSFSEFKLLIEYKQDGKENFKAIYLANSNLYTFDIVAPPEVA